MAENSLYYYVRNAGLDESLQFSISFSTISGSCIPVETGNPLYYGIVSGPTGSFLNVSGSGFFSGNTLDINRADLMDKSNWTALMIFERASTGNQVLISTMGSGSPSGIVFGINDASKYYLSTWDTQGFFTTKTFNNSIATENGIAVVKNGSTFSIVDFNFQEMAGYSDGYTFPITANINSDLLSFGGANKVPSGIPTGYMTGFFDEISFFNAALSVNTVEQLFKGYFTSNPVQTYGLVSKSEKYNYIDVGNFSGVNFDSITSGGLDYIRNYIFNQTGIGQITAVSSGVISNGSGNVSGFLSGQVYLPTGYQSVLSGQRVTGYLTSGNVATESGITGYSLVTLTPFDVFSGDIEKISGYSGIVGATKFTPVFTGPLYQTYYYTGTVSGRVFTNYFQTFSYPHNQAGESGNISFLNTGIYVNNGKDQILAQNILNYSGLVTLNIIKNSTFNYGFYLTEGSVNQDFINRFLMDGAVCFSDVTTGEVLSVNSISKYSKLNNEMLVDLLSGNFKTPEQYGTGEVIFFINGVLQETGISDISTSYDGSYLNQNLVWDRNDIGEFDAGFGFGIQKRLVLSSPLVSGSNIFSGESGGLLFLNGQNLTSGIDFSVTSSGLKIITNSYSGISGQLSLINAFSGSLSTTTGASQNLKMNFPKRGSIFFKDGIRKELGADYKEISKFDKLFGFTGQQGGTFIELTP